MMDIFTTQLTRVVPVPIKPVTLKVKALLKEAPNSKLNHDPEHIEYHEYLFTQERDQYHASQQQPEKALEASDSNKNEQSALQELDSELSDEVAEQKKTPPKHLDLYV